MHRTEFFVEDLINNDEIFFGDSSVTASRAHRSGVIDDLTNEMCQCGSANKDAKLVTMELKLNECSQEFIDSVATHGITNPVGMLGDTIMDGHHRLAVAQHLGIKVPVNVCENWDEFDLVHRWEVKGSIDSLGNLMTETY